MRQEPEMRLAIRIGDLGLSNLPPRAGFPYLDDNRCRAKPGARPEAVVHIKATAFKRVVQSMNFHESRGRKKSDAVRGIDRQHGAVRRQRRSLELRGRREGRYRSEVRRDQRSGTEHRKCGNMPGIGDRKAESSMFELHFSERGNRDHEFGWISNGKPAFRASGDGFVWRVAVASPARKTTPAESDAKVAYEVAFVHDLYCSLRAPGSCNIFVTGCIGSHYYRHLVPFVSLTYLLVTWPYHGQRSPVERPILNPRDADKPSTWICKRRAGTVSRQAA